MRERPILFTGPMVRAILAGNKTQTRRVVKPWEPRPGSAAVPADISYLPDFTCYRTTCPYGQPGDRLWVRETWNRFEPWAGFYYAADYEAFGIGPDDDPDHIPDHEVRWKPSIHMPRSACRLMLEITGVRVERLNAISEEDARAEGCPFTWDGNQYEPPPPEVDSWQGYGRASFSLLWSQINGPDSWAANPWVWVVEFRRIKNGGANG